MKLAYTERIGWPLVLFLSFIPLIIWAIEPYSLDQRFFRRGELSFMLTMQALGQALGLVGMAMFALNLALGARLKWMESMFGGMNKVYIAHHILGGLSFILLLLHPVFLIAQYAKAGGLSMMNNMTLYLVNPQCMANISLVSADCAALWGVVSLGLMIVFLVLTFFVALPYNIWKITHKFLGAAFFFGAVHALFIPSDVAVVVALKYYMVFLVTIGFAALLYRTVLGFVFVRTLDYIVEEVRQVNSTIVEIVMRPKDESAHVQYKPGQFIFIGFPDTTGLEEVHPFSLSSAPEGNRIAIGVKALGDYTKRLNELKPGARASVEGPFGRTSYVYHPNKEQIWIAGGIGITPFLSMARSLKPEDGYRVDLYYSAATSEDAAFDAELRAIAEKNPNFRLLPWYGKEKGFLSAEAITKESSGLLGKEIFLCGPPGMMKALKAQFATIKIPTRHIHSEEFSMN